MKTISIKSEEIQNYHVEVHVITQKRLNDVYLCILLILDGEEATDLFE